MAAVGVEHSQAHHHVPRAVEASRIQNGIGPDFVAASCIRSRFAEFTVVVQVPLERQLAPAEIATRGRQRDLAPFIDRVWPARIGRRLAVRDQHGCRRHIALRTFVVERSHFDGEVRRTFEPDRQKRRIRAALVATRRDRTGLAELAIAVQIPFIAGDRAVGIAARRGQGDVAPFGHGKHRARRNGRTLVLGHDDVVAVAAAVGDR